MTADPRRVIRRTEPGTYLERTAEGRLRPAAPGTPDYTICRRVVDYAPAPVPPEAAIGACAQCAAAIAFDPRGPHRAHPRLCMQCAGITPLPFEEP